MNPFYALFWKCPRTLRLVFTVHLVILSVAASAQEDLLYDVDFSAPTHVIHHPPITGTATNRVSEVIFGSPEVVPDFGHLADRPLLFRGRAGYDQIGFDITPGWAKYRVEYEIVTSNLQNSDYAFSVTLDTPGVRTFHLQGKLNRAYSYPGLASDVSPQLWEDGKKSRFVIEADLAQNRWEVWQDGIKILSTALNATMLKRVRFNLGHAIAGAPENQSVAAGLDNIRITAMDRVYVAPPKGPGSPGQEATLFDVNFDAPTHSLYQLPEAGPSIHHISEVLLGSPKVVPGFDALQDRPLLFRGSEDYGNIRLNLPPGWPKYRIEYDLVTDNLKDSGYKFGVSLVFRGGEYQHLLLHGADRSVRVLPTGSVSTQLWEERKKMNFVIDVDLAAGRSEIRQDGILISVSSVAAKDLSLATFSLTPGTGGMAANASVAAAVDNIRIRGFDHVTASAPPQPSMLTRGKSQGIQLSWPEVKFMHGYAVYRNRIDDFETADLLAHVPSAAPIYLDLTAQADTKYFYWVTSFRDGIESVASAAGIATMEPGPPSLLSISRGDRTDGIALFWRPGAHAESYRIYRSQVNDLALATSLAETRELSFLDTSAKAGTKYFYWVKSMWSDSPPERSAGGYGVRGLMPTQSLTITFNDKAESVFLQWRAVTGASHYTIYRSHDGLFSNALSLGRISDLNFADDTAVVGDDYHYWVIPGTAETSDFSVAPGSILPSSSQPDLWTQDTSGETMGRGIANKSGVGQTVTMSKRNGRSIKGTIWITTLGAGKDAISLSGSEGNRHFKTKYLMNGNITAGMTAGRLYLSVGPDLQSVAVVVVPHRRARITSATRSLALHVRGTSLGNRSASDLVILRTMANSGR